MKKLKLWPVITLIVVLLGSGGGIYAWRHSSTSAKSATLPANTQLVAVKVGNVINSVTASGSLSYPNKSNLAFGVAGTVLQVNVAANDTVKKGQVLAKLDTMSLENAVAQAQLNLYTVQTNLDTAQNPYTATDLQQAQATVAQAEFNLRKTQQALTDAQTADPLVVATRQNAVANAKQALTDAQKVDPLVVAADQNSVTQAQIALQNAQDNLTTVLDGPSASDLARASAVVLQAEVALEAATAALPTALPDTLTIGSYSNYLTKQAAFQTAQANLQAAKDAQTTLLVSPSIADVTKARLGVSQAQAALSQAQSNLTKALVVDLLVVQNKQVVLSQAQEDLANAQTPDPLAIAQKRVDITNAQAALAKANDALDKVKAGADPDNVTAAKLQYQVAKTAYDYAVAQVSSAALVAPYDGTVTVVSIVAGQSVGGNTMAITMVDTSNIQDNASVSEVDVAKVKAGQQVILAVDALSGMPIIGKVSAVSVVGQTSSGVVSYPITVQVTILPGLQLREGMSATATLVVQQVNNVLVVPNRAIGGTSQKPTVTVVVNGQNEVKPVTLGLADSSNTQVLSGLNEGEQVLVSTAGSSGNQGFFNGAGGFPGGGMPPGGIPSGGFPGGGMPGLGG